MDKRLWSEAPPRLIQTEIMKCLSASKVVESVIPADVQVDFDYALSGEVRELLVETQGERHQAIVAFDVFVTQRRPRRLLWSGSYRHREDTGDQTAQGFVNAVERTLETLCVQMTTDLRNALKVQEQASAASSTVRSTSRPDRGTSPPT